MKTEIANLNYGQASRVNNMVPRLSPFMAFWQSMNAVLKSRGLPDMLYGEARGFWEDHEGSGWK